MCLSWPVAWNVSFQKTNKISAYYTSEAITCWKEKHVAGDIWLVSMWVVNTLHLKRPFLDNFSYTITLFCFYLQIHISPAGKRWPWSKSTTTSSVHILLYTIKWPCSKSWLMSSVVDLHFVNYFPNIFYLLLVIHSQASHRHFNLFATSRIQMLVEMSTFSV